MCGDCGGKQAEQRVVRSPKLAECCQQPRPRQPSGRGGAPCIGDYETHLYEPLEKDICDQGPNEPYHIPGYAGQVPTLQSLSGGTYGHDTHDILSSGERPAATPSFGRPGHVCPSPMHEPYRLPGYTGHVPGLQFMVGGSYGLDTHRLLYMTRSYPDRQETLSPGQTAGRYDGIGNRGAGLMNSPLCSTVTVQPGATLSALHYQKPEEHYYSPQYKYRIGDTYSTTADISLVDPCVNRESKLIVSTRQADDTQVVRTQESLGQRVQDAPHINRPIRHRPMVPGFDAFVDALRGARGQRFESGSGGAALQPQQQLVLPKRAAKVSNANDEGRQKRQQSSSLSLSPVTGEVPFGYGRYADGRHKYTNSAVCDFASNYRGRRGTEWAPAGVTQPDPPRFDTPARIYDRHAGLLPGYSAHIPGALFRCGKTFTDDSRDAKSALRGD